MRSPHLIPRLNKKVVFAFSTQLFTFKILIRFIFIISVLECDPLILTHASINSDLRLFNSTVHVTCDLGHRIDDVIDHVNLTCGEEGRWTDDVTSVNCSRNVLVWRRVHPKKRQLKQFKTGCNVLIPIFIPISNIIQTCRKFKLCAFFLPVKSV